MQKVTEAMRKPKKEAGFRATAKDRDHGPRLPLEEAERWLRDAIADATIQLEVEADDPAPVLKKVLHAMAQTLIEVRALRDFLPEQGGAA